MVSPRPSLTFAGKAGAVTVFYSESRLLQTRVVMFGEENALAYYGMELITTVKSFIAQVLSLTLVTSFL